MSKKKNKKEQSNKRAFASGKKGGFKPLNPLGANEVGIAETEIMKDLYAYVLPVNLLLDTSIKGQCLAEVRGLMDDFGKRNIVYIPKNGVIPEGAKRLDYFLFLTRERMGIPLADFLVYLKGANAASDISSWMNMPVEKLPEAYKALIRFFRDVLDERHRKQERDYGIFRPADIIGATNYYNFGTINHNYSK